MFERENHEPSLLSESMGRLNVFLRQLNWPTLLSGLAIGLVMMQVLVGQSVNRRMDRLTAAMAETERQMNLLAGSATDVGQTNDLLARLTTQRQQVRAATDTLVELQRLRTQVERDSSRLDKAMAALQQIHKLQGELVDRAPQMEQAVRTVDASIALQSKIAEMGRSLPQQSAGIDEARTVLNQLALLKQVTLDEKTNIEAAREQMNSMSTIIKGLVIAGDKMLEARTAASELLALKDLLTMNEDGLDRSQAAADSLVAMQEQLAGIPQIRVDEARNNMLAMVEIQQKLSSQTRQVAQSVENLELMADFQIVLGEQLTSLEGIRRQLTDLVLMESTLARAARVLSPLAEISNIRNLRDDEEVREAARRVLDRRLGQATDHAAETQVAEGVKGEVTTMASPDEVFDTPARPAPIPPME